MVKQLQLRKLKLLKQEVFSAISAIIILTLSSFNATIYGQAIIPDFAFSPTTIVEGGVVNFTDLSTGSPTKWKWNFDGGNPSIDSVNQNPSNIQYNTPGIWEVRFRCSNGSGYSYTKYKWVNVVSNKPISDFNANTTTITYGDSVQFNDLSTQNPTSWSWDLEISDQE